MKSYNNCQNMWIIFIIIILICMVCNNLYKFKVESFDNKLKSNKPLKKTYNLGVCSKNCCATQWPTSINVNEKSKIKPNDIGSKYFTSNITCNNGIINTGCVCLTKESKQLLEKKGYVQQLPLANGLLDEDNRVGVYQLSDNLINKPAVLGQTIELTGTKINFDSIMGVMQNSDKFSSVDSEQNIMNNYSIPINNNFINWDNEMINKNLEKNILTTNLKTNTDKLMNNRIGINTTEKNIK